MANNSILVVDDDFDLRENIVQALVAEDYKVIEATNGIEALSMLEKHAPSGSIGCIILDLMMPEMDGAEFLEVFKTKHPDWYKKIPVIIATAKGSPMNPTKIPAHTARIQKPMDLEELYSVVKKHFVA